MSPKIKIFGYRGPFNATERIEKELVGLGCILSDTPDYVIHTTGLYEDSEEFCAKLSYKPRKLYILLDIDEDKPDFDEFYKNAKKHLEGADVVCAISDVVRTQMREILGITKSIEIVRYPIRPLTIINKPWEERSLEFLCVGRINTKNKRIKLLYDFANQNNIPLSKFYFAGNEKPPFGNWFQSPNDEQLSEIYSESKFVLSPSSFEGLGLTPIEGLLNSCIPMVCKDNPVIYELGLDAFATDPTPLGLWSLYSIMKANPEYYLNNEDLKGRFRAEFDVKNIAKRILRLLKGEY